MMLLVLGMDFLEEIPKKYSIFCFAHIFVNTGLKIIFCQHQLN
jgi:hypothetical protein